MNKISKDWVDAYFDYGVDVTNRCIFLFGDFNEDSIGAVVQGMYLMENQNSNHDPIELRICSYGGNMDDMFALHDVTRTLKSPVHIMGMGKIMSAAILIVACGQKGERWAGANTCFMVHPPSWCSENSKMHEHEAMVSITKRQWNRWYDLMAFYTNKPAKFWRQKCENKSDFYFDAQEALEWGLIDHIWDEKAEHQDGEE